MSKVSGDPIFDLLYEIYQVLPQALDDWDNEIKPRVKGAMDAYESTPKVSMGTWPLYGQEVPALEPLAPKRPLPIKWGDDYDDRDKPGGVGRPKPNPRPFSIKISRRKDTGNRYYRRSVARSGRMFKTRSFGKVRRNEKRKSKIFKA